MFPDNVGVYISRVEEGSIAEKSGLRPGDSILEVNGIPFTNISHDEALKVSAHLCGIPLMCLCLWQVFNAKFVSCFSSRKNIYNLKKRKEIVRSIFRIRHGWRFFFLSFSSLKKKLKFFQP